MSEGRWKREVTRGINRDNICKNPATHMSQAHVFSLFAYISIFTHVFDARPCSTGGLNCRAMGHCGMFSGVAHDELEDFTSSVWWQTSGQLSQAANVSQVPPVTLIDFTRTRTRMISCSVAEWSLGDTRSKLRT